MNSNRGLDAAHAPYNFISLPDKIIEYPSAIPPAQHRYQPDRHSGYFDVTLRTETPLYVRSPLTLEQARKRNEDQAKGVEKTWKDDKPDFFYTDENTKRPVIPGSSLRGMIRSLFEIVTYSKIQPLNSTTKIFYRAVAARRQDALGQEYNRHMGSFGKNIRAGYLRQREDRWFIQPAQQFGDEYYAKVKDKHDVVGGVKNIKHLNDSKYELAHFNVVYSTASSRRGPYVIKVSSPRDDSEPHTAVLVCTGNMKETISERDKNKPIPRKNFSLILLPDDSKREIPISPQAVLDYKDGLSPFLIEQLGKNGILADGNPVFYLLPETGYREVTQFGHNPYFRLAAQVRDTEVGLRALTPADRVPPELHHSDVLDYAEAVFGYVREGQSNVAFAGRVSVTQADLVGDESDLYEDIFTPLILGSPKPTAFMHYLKQDDSANLSEYQHYGSPNARIRGHKLYWRKRLNGLQSITANPNDMKDKPKQYTQIRPVKSGRQFYFRVYFDNLDNVELGALSWVMSLGDDSRLRHMLGMGKPYGLGILKLLPHLTLIQREVRYAGLFEGDTWRTGEQPTEYAPFIDDFKAHLARNDVDFDKSERLKELREMLSFWANDNSLEYMALERFKDRPVLPKPMQVARKLKPTE